MLGMPWRFGGFTAQKPDFSGQTAQPAYGVQVLAECLDGRAETMDYGGNALDDVVRLR